MPQNETKGVTQRYMSPAFCFILDLKYWISIVNHHSIIYWTSSVVIHLKCLQPGKGSRQHCTMYTVHCDCRIRASPISFLSKLIYFTLLMNFAALLLVRSGPWGSIMRGNLMSADWDEAIGGANDLIYQDKCQMLEIC